MKFLRICKWFHRCGWVECEELQGVHHFHRLSWILCCDPWEIIKPSLPFPSSGLHCHAPLQWGGAAEVPAYQRKPCDSIGIGWYNKIVVITYCCIKSTCCHMGGPQLTFWRRDLKSRLIILRWTYRRNLCDIPTQSDEDGEEETVPMEMLTHTRSRIDGVAMIPTAGEI